jgi:UDP-GlcNAc:undecaprenyl-phosphate GlcNAc-1-phosphate transferase
MTSYLLTYLVSLALALIFIPIIIFAARKYNWMDNPNVRSAHKQPIPRLGGIAIFLAFLIAVVLTFLFGESAYESYKKEWLLYTALLLGSTMIFFVGLWDDLRSLHAGQKLGIQVVGALIVTMAGARVTQITAQDVFSINLGWMSYPISFLWIIGVTNSINLIDGVDGLAAGISMIACGVVAILSVLRGNFVLAILMFGLLGSLTGFLRYNFHPARIFMGDCGSLFLGFTIAGATLIISSQTKSLIGIGLPILVLCIPIFDTFFSILRRFLERRSLMSPDHRHFHHKLLQRGFKHYQVALTAYAITLAISGLGMFMLITRGVDSILLFAICLLLMLLVFRAVGAVSLVDTLQGLRGRSEILRLQKAERKVFEDAQLEFRNAQDYEQWWHCMCMAAKAMDVASVSLELSKGNNEPHVLMWNNSKCPGRGTKNSTLRIDIPLPDCRQESNSNFRVEIPVHRSLEEAGRKVALLTRLTEEHGLNSLRSSDDTTRDNPEGRILSSASRRMFKMPLISSMSIPVNSWLRHQK